MRSSLLYDLLAGLIVAALSIPISMGYAELAGMPAIYGLYASIIAPIAFAIFTKTTKTVFGMDSATVAMTASMLALLGISTSDASIAIMPAMTILTAVFLGILALVKAGTLIKMIPMPVIHGFIFGIAIVVIFGQIPHLAGLPIHLPESIIDAVPVLIAAIPDASVACVLLSTSCIASIIFCKGKFPHFPCSIIILLIAALIAQALSAAGMNIIYLPEVSGSLPQIADFSATLDYVLSPSIFGVIASSFAIAIIIALESLLCLETFSSSESEMFSPNREIVALGGANAIVGIFGCPPCSASMSRTAAGISAGAKTKFAAIFSAIIIALVALVAGAFMQFLPRCALSAIVVVALLDIVNWSKMKTYIFKLRYDFSIFALSAVLVILFGAVVGIAGGIAMSIIIMIYQKRREDDVELVGAVPYSPSDTIDKEEIFSSFSIAICKLPTHLTFASASKILDNITKQAAGKDALLLKTSKLTNMDSSAADRLRVTLDVIESSGTAVKIIRKIRPTENHVTRYGIRRLMRDYDSYPSISTALESLALDPDSEENIQQGRQKHRTSEEMIEIIEQSTSSFAPVVSETKSKKKNAKTVLPTIDEVNAEELGLPVVTISALRDTSGNLIVSDDGYVMIEDVKGKLSFMDIHKAYLFKAEFASEAAGGKAKDVAAEHKLFSRIIVFDEKDWDVVMDYRNGVMDSTLDYMTYDVVASQIAAAVAPLLDKAAKETKKKQ